MSHFRAAHKCQEISRINKASLCHLGKGKSHCLVTFHVLHLGKKIGKLSLPKQFGGNDLGHSFPSENVLIHNVGIG